MVKFISQDMADRLYPEVREQMERAGWRVMPPPRRREVIRATSVRLFKLDPNGQPVGEPIEMGPVLLPSTPPRDSPGHALETEAAELRVAMNHTLPEGTIEIDGPRGWEMSAWRWSPDLRYAPMFDEDFDVCFWVACLPGGRPMRSHP